MKAHRSRQNTVFLPILAAFLLLLPFGARAEKVSDLPQPTDYVSDFAHVLSPEAVARIDAICAALDHSTAHAQIAMVTVQNLDGDEAADYANQLEDHWKMGDKGQNRYALVLLAVDDHKYRVETGYGVEGVLNDAKVGDIGRAMVPDLRAKDYDGAALYAVGTIAQDLAADAHITLNVDMPAAPVEYAPVEQHHGGAIAKLILLIIVLCFFGGFSLLRMLFGWGLFFGGWGRGGWGGGGFGGGGFGGGGFGGGGFGGGGGGGFGGFGGGGGGFGGGGAGGSW
ncbi:MAG TPA: TPM domain-containing protein [Terracidiphilus sp.]|nr:TPM domain-containing protein [Terracidiphilus sp.]